MTLTAEDLRHLARMGAQARLAELGREREAILRTFPELGKVSSQSTEPRRRRRMSAAARRRISQAMKKRWAERRKQAGRR